MKVAETTMEHLVTNLETSKALKEAGFPQAADRVANAYCDQPDCEELKDGEYLLPVSDRYCESCSLAVIGLAAPTAQEIADQFASMGPLDIGHYGGKWRASLQKFADRGIAKTYPSMVEALAGLYIKLNGDAS